ncbi:MAG: tRNA (adenosine(37)-N6)-threonylcarbamoyltransferase complex ATPase subunit type 1 TsaE [Phascolarctobacterium sp.]|nr:tRNA (adenosine(37)-N6)-threonylcarbamoyltransferase complex ATPase subunit type 1 TsaE [Phascolarctobacterium sp.]
MEIFLQDVEATLNFGRILGSVLQDGDVVCLTGDLGAGKTSLSKGICLELGVNANDVTSPTFAIMNIYEGTIHQIRHFDLYRINRAEELYDIGFDEYVGGRGISLIEWAELFEEELPYEYLIVTITREGEGRKATLTAKGKRYLERIQEAMKKC